MKEPIFKEDLRIEAFNIVKRIADGETNLQEEAKQLMALRDFAVEGLKSQPRIDIPNGIGCELPGNRKVVVGTNINRDIYVQFTNHNLITDVLMSEDAFLSMVICAAKIYEQRD